MNSSSRPRHGVDVVRRTGASPQGGLPTAAARIEDEYDRKVVSNRPGAGPLWSITIAAETAVPVSDALLGSLVSELHADVDFDEDRRRFHATLLVRARRDFAAAAHAVDRLSAVLRGAEPRITEPVTCMARS